MAYLIVFIILFLLFATSHFPLNERSKTGIFGFSFLLLLFFAGFRYETGYDWNTYEDLFDATITLNKLSFAFFKYAGSEPGYMLLSSIVKTFGGNYQIFLFVVAFITLTFYYKAIAEFSKDKMLSILIFFCLSYLFMVFSILRQGLAVSICFFSLKFLLGKQMWKYFLYVAMATTVHFTAIIMLPLYFVLNKQISKQWLYVLTGIGLFLIFFSVPWLKSLLLFIGQFIPDSRFMAKALFYTSDYVSIRGVSVMSFVNAWMLILFTAYRKQGKQESKYYNIFLNLFALYVFSNIFFYEILTLSVRIGYYFIVGYFILPTFFISLQTLKQNKVIITALFCSLIFYNSRHLFFESPGEIVYNPYQNYLIYKITKKQSTAGERFEQYLEQRQLKE